MDEYTNYDTCRRCGAQLESDTFKDALELSGRYFSIYLRACPTCGDVDKVEAE